MTDDKIALKFTPLPLEDAGGAKSIRMIGGAGHSAMAMLAAAPGGGTAVYVLPIEESGVGSPRSLFNLSSPFGAPSWDIAAGQGGFAAVWTRPGSAICPLAYRGTGGAVTILTGHYPSGVFQAPRFVRGEPAGSLALTTVAYQRNSRVLALFSDSLEGNPTYAPLPSAGPSLLLDGLALRNGSGYVVIAKLLATGERGAERKNRFGGSIAPGVLRSLALNAKLQLVGGILSPIGDAPVFEFDADVSNGRVFLAATTENGAIAAVGSAIENQVRWTDVVNLPQAGELMAPCVLATDAGSALSAAIEVSGTPPRARILMGLMTNKRP